MSPLPNVIRDNPVKLIDSLETALISKILSEPTIKLIDNAVLTINFNYANTEPGGISIHRVCFFKKLTH